MHQAPATGKALCPTVESLTCPHYRNCDHVIKDINAWNATKLENAAIWHPISSHSTSSIRRAV